MSKDLLPMVADIVSAQISQTSMTREELTEAIRLVYTTLSGLSAQGVPETGGVAQPSAPDREPAVAIEKSVFPDYIICLEDGKKLKMLKRHLMAAYGLSPEQYRARWNLPATYPVTAPNYSERRSKLAAGKWSWAQAGFHEAGARAGAAREGGRQWKKGSRPPEEGRRLIARRCQRQQGSYLAGASCLRLPGSPGSPLWRAWQRLPPSDGPRLLPRLGVVRDAGEAAA